MRSVIFIWLLFAVSQARAEDIKFSSHTERDRYKIGEWVQLVVAADIPRSVTVIAPVTSDSIGGFEVLNVDATELPDGQRRHEWNFRLITFDTGRVFVPPIQFFYQTEDDTTRKLAYSTPVALTVVGVDVDLQGDIKDIKPPLDAPWLFEDYLPYILLLLVLLIVVGALVYWRRKRRRSIEPDRFVRRVPPHETALAALRDLEDARLWQQGKTKEYYSRVTEIIRVYLEGQYGVPALESTSDEILSVMKNLDRGQGVFKELTSFLLTADLVKFAKYVPTLEENTQELASAYTIVRSTMTPVEPERRVQEKEDVHVR